MDRLRDELVKAFYIDPALLAADPMPTRTEIVMRMARDKAARDERTVLQLLGQWVSELEPAVCVDRTTHEIIGLCLAGDPTGQIVIYAGPDPRPLLREALGAMGFGGEAPQIVRMGHYNGNDF